MLELNKIYNENCIDIYYINNSMSKKGYKQSEEHKKNKSLAMKKAHELKKFGFEKGNTAKRMTGKKHSEETKKKISDKLKINNPMFSEKARKKQSETKKQMGYLKGENNPNWKGGISAKHLKIRNSFEYKEWRRSVFKRDNWTCQKCGTRSGKAKNVILNADHIKSFADFPELRFDIDNGNTLCLECHKKTKNYGWKHYNERKNRNQ